MAMNLRRPPVDVLHMPSLNEGISYVGNVPTWIVRPGTEAIVRMFAASDNATVKNQQQATINRYARRMPRGTFEIRSAPVVLKDAKFARGLVRIADRFWLNGASGDRARKKFEADNPEPWRRRRYVDAFRRARKAGSAKIGVVSRHEADQLPVALEMKNGFNYYHFSAETLGSLAHFSGDGGNEPIRIHLPGSHVKNFISSFISTIFPDLSDRVEFIFDNTHYDEVRSVYSHKHYIYSASNPIVDAALNSPDVDPEWSKIARSPSGFSVVAMQSYDCSIRMLRNAALRQISNGQSVSMPRLIWMGRDESGDARARGISGHQRLLSELRERGFEQVAFEHLSPAEQISAMNGADVVIAPHGAGLANMIYAKESSRVIEIGTRQTQLHRWGDFLKCAHVSGCHYDTVFADVEGVSDASYVPPMSTGHRGIRLGEEAVKTILSIVDKEANA